MSLTLTDNNKKTHAEFDQGLDSMIKEAEKVKSMKKEGKDYNAKTSSLWFSRGNKAIVTKNSARNDRGATKGRSKCVLRNLNKKILQVNNSIIQNLDNFIITSISLRMAIYKPNFQKFV